MVLYSFNWGEAATWVLVVLSLGTIVILMYRRLLMKLNTNNLNTADYCDLHSLEKEVVGGTTEIYFTSEIDRDAKIILLDQDLKEVKVIKEGHFTKGGNIVRFDTTTVPNGQYYFSLITDNQKTTKKMHVRN